MSYDYVHYGDNLYGEILGDKLYDRDRNEIGRVGYESPLSGKREITDDYGHNVGYLDSNNNLSIPSSYDISESGESSFSIWDGICNLAEIIVLLIFVFAFSILAIVGLFYWLPLWLLDVLFG